MPIVNPNPVIVPPTPEVVYPYIWLYNIMIHAPTIDTGRITIETLPYNADTQSIGSGDYIQTIQTDLLWQAVAEVPEVAAAMQAIIDAVEPLNNWIISQNQPPVTPEVPEVPEIPEVVEV
jgi:hypothetical protein